MFENPSDESTQAILKKSRRIAVVGLSPNPARPSFGVSKIMRTFGYQIVPVRPAVTDVMGEKAYPDIQSVPGEIDLVNVFRNANELMPIIDACIERRVPAIWIQEGIINEEAANKAKAAGIWVIMDRCIYKDYLRLCR
ncbi:CoA-binding protein [Leeia sp. TBRC 13508]|uniref:CoA-binding protein n=1 Tax=Leeia speluncae TaxID=2884804 RepID=A0ABS8D382_9NEIS|nr:CoA-binding protein [Leeia speluncae]MCB6182671.1 CoA-binding protein [Leeia speluncae]